MTLEADDLEELAGDIKRLIESNRTFLDRLNDEDYDCEEEAEADDRCCDLEDYEEL